MRQIQATRFKAPARATGPRVQVGSDAITYALVNRMTEIFFKRERAKIKIINNKEVEDKKKTQDNGIIEARIQKGEKCCVEIYSLSPVKELTLHNKIIMDAWGHNNILLI